MKKRLLSFILTVAIVMAMFVSPVMAWSAINTKCYTITTGNTMVYNSNSTSSGKKGTIFSSDEIKILKSYSNGFYYVEYPITRGTKKGYILKSAVLINTSASTRYASSKITAYRRNSTNNTYGSIFKNDEVLVFGTRGSFTQVRYPVSGGYKFAWIKTTDANNYLKKTKATGSSSSPSSYKGKYYGTPQKGTYNGVSFCVFRQTDDKWKNEPYLKGDFNGDGTYEKATVGTSACHLLSLVNGTYWLTGKFIDPVALARYAIKKGYRTNGSIKMKQLYQDIANNYGGYGIKYVGYADGNKKNDYFKDLKNHLNNGEIAIGGGMGHVMAVVAYNSNTDKYLILDSYPSSKRGTSSTWYIWKSRSQMTGKFGFTYFYFIGRR